VLNLLFCILAYLVGSFPTGVVLTRRKYGLDVRDMGSGNIGATNVTRVFGWYAGVLVFLIDFLKGWAPVAWVALRYPEEPWLRTGVGACLVLGHCFSAFLRFRGGKGVATSLGVLLAVLPWAAVAGGVVYVILLVVTRISAVGSLGGMLAVLVFLAFRQPAQADAVLILIISILVVSRHHSNIRRLWGDLKNKRNKA